MTDETKNIQFGQEDNEEQSSFNFATIYKMLILNWQWFLLSLIICIGAAYLYLRYTSPVYSTAAKLLIKSDQGGRGGRGASLSSLNDLSSIGTINYGLENEKEIITSSTIAAQAVRDLKLYTNYWMEGKIKDRMLYKDQPLNVDVDPVHLDKLNSPISINIKYENKKYHVTGEYRVPVDELYSKGPYLIDKTFTGFPATINTGAGIITIDHNPSVFKTVMKDGMTLKVSIMSPRSVAYSYVAALSVEQVSKSSDVFSLRLNDTNIQRGKDYLNQLAICYNKQANDDKNEISVRTEEFINDRLGKISTELGNTEGELESFKRRNNLVELKINARESVAGASSYEQKLAEANTQIALVNSLIEVINESHGSYDVLPANIGISDNTATSLISTYNQIVLERNRLLKTASENNPSVTPLTSQLDDLKTSIRQALQQAKRSSDIQREAIASQLGQYSGEISKTPEQERILTQIGRQQEIKSGLYLMLLQKREENSINLAATADKGKLIEVPQYAGKIGPKNNVIMLGAFAAGLAIPGAIIFLLGMLRFRIEGHDDVEKLTKLPILADIAVANDSTKTKADIVVHENQNNTMEEIFRSLRTNIQFMLKKEEKTIMFTSSLSGEGKTFTAANLAVSFALLGKKVVLVGLDIRKPRLSELFEIHNHHNGITNLLVMDNPEWEDVKEQVVPSGINKNLELLMAGPIAPNPAELISRDSLEIIINHLKEHYDYIIIDTAPVGLVTDTLQISRVANICISVCRADYTPKKCFESINDFANSGKLPNMAIVINGIDMSKKKYSYSYGYGSYGKYGSRYDYGKNTAYGSYNNSHYGQPDDNSIKK